MSNRLHLVTGGTGFIGAALVRKLLATGERVRVLDDDSRGSRARLRDVEGRFEFVAGDVRDPATVDRASQGVDVMCHLAFVNGTEFFYSRPELVLDVAVKGMVNVLDACRKQGVRSLLLMSSSEVYQTPAAIPTDETVALSIPDVHNPRYSYAGGKIISELMAINYGGAGFDRVVIVRPHNVYGPAMGFEHVIPQFAVRLHRLKHDATEPLPFPIQGSGDATRAFVYIDDFIDGTLLAMERGQHLGIYHIGTTEEISMRELADRMGRCFGRRIAVVPGPEAKGGTPRRCPDIGKIASLGYSPRFTLDIALPIVARWYDEHAGDAPA